MEACLNLLPQSEHSCVGVVGAVVVNAVAVDNADVASSVGVVILQSLLAASALLGSDIILARSEMENGHSVESMLITY